MLIVWRGWGITVPLIVVASSSVVGMPLAMALAKGDAALGLGFSIGAVVAGGLIWLLARKLDARPLRVLVDPATEQRIYFKKDAGSLFFIPTRVWAYIVGALGLLGLIGAVAGQIA